MVPSALGVALPVIVVPGTAIAEGTGIRVGDGERVGGLGLGCSDVLWASAVP
jgi:hypothetical protein